MLDLAIQSGGTLEVLFELAQANNISATMELSSGVELSVPVFQKADTEIQNYYAKYNIRPATGLTGISGGIGYGQIGQIIVG